ncbi:MAG: hypothetical protein RLZZ283_152 [Candidatus Parcubacteria bacterium]|jgi:DNA-binding CsgD family transcriptional regulator
MEVGLHDNDRRLADLVALGLPVRKIGARLGIQAKTVYPKLDRIGVSRNERTLMWKKVRARRYILSRLKSERKIL